MPNERERSLREQVAEIVGYVCHLCDGRGSPTSPSRICAHADMPKYEISADAALEAYQAVRAHGLTMDVVHLPDNEPGWRVRLWGTSGGAHSDGWGDTLPLAICQAIVAAHGREKA